MYDSYLYGVLYIYIWFHYVTQWEPAGLVWINNLNAKSDIRNFKIGGFPPKNICEYAVLAYMYQWAI